MYNSNLDEEKLLLNCNYLILIENQEQEIIPVKTLSKVIEICAAEQRMCRVYERAGSVGRNWHYLCDISRGVI